MWWRGRGGWLEVFFLPHKWIRNERMDFVFWGLACSLAYLPNQVREETNEGTFVIRERQKVGFHDDFDCLYVRTCSAEWVWAWNLLTESWLLSVWWFVSDHAIYSFILRWKLQKRKGMAWSKYVCPCFDVLSAFLKSKPFSVRKDFWEAHLFEHKIGIPCYDHPRHDWNRALNLYSALWFQSISIPVCDRRGLFPPSFR